MSLLRGLGLNKLASAYQPKPRLLPFAGAVGGQCVIFAGITDDFRNTKEELSSTVEVFDQYMEQWRALRATGSSPTGLYGGGCCVSPTGDLYVYGGTDGSDCRGGLYKLNLPLIPEWSQLSVESDRNGPMRKSGCGMVCFNKEKIAVIGGYGIPHVPPQPGSSFIKSIKTDGRGYTNEIHFFDTEKCKLK